MNSLPKDTRLRSLNINKYLPPLLFAGLTLLFFYRVLLSGQVLRASDFILSYNIFIKFALDYFREHQTIPYWLPYIYGGMPVVECLLVPFFYPLFWLLFFLPFALAMNLQYLIHIFLAGFFCYLLALEMGMRRSSALFSGVAYMFCGSVLTILAAGHFMKVYTYGLYPLLFLFVYRGLKTRRAFYFIAAGGVMGLLLLSLHMQVIFYGMMMVSLFIAYWLLADYRAEKQVGWLVKGTVLYLVMVVLGLGIGMAQFYPALTYMDYSHRQKGVSYEFATSWSYPPEELAALIAPGFAGEKTEYFGRIPFMDRNHYTSVVPFLLALIALFNVRRREVYFLAGAALFILTIALGGYTPIYRLYYHLIPGINKFRLPMSSMYLFGLFQALLAGLGLEWLTTRQEEGQRFYRLILGAFCLVALTAFGLLVFKEPIAAWLVKLASSDQYMKYKWVDLVMAKQNLGMTLKSLVYLSVVLLLSGGAFFSLRYAAVRRYFPVLLVILVSLDLFIVNSRYLHPAKADADYYKEGYVWNYLKNDQDLFRVHRIGMYRLPRRLGVGNVAVYHRIYSTNGYYQNPIGRYYDIEDADDGVLNKNASFLALSNVKYVVSSSPVRNQFLTPLPSVAPVYFYRNEYVLPRFFLTHAYQVVADPKEIISRLSATDPRNLRDLVYLEQEPGLTPQIPGADAVETVKVDKYLANVVSLRVELAADGLLVMSEVFYPAWEAVVDGVPQKILIGNYFMRVLPLKAGRHQIEMRYNPRAMKTGIMITLISSLICLLSLALLERFTN